MVSLAIWYYLTFSENPIIEKAIPSNLVPISASHEITFVVKKWYFKTSTIRYALPNGDKQYVTCTQINQNHVKCQSPFSDTPGTVSLEISLDHENFVSLDYPIIIYSPYTVVNTMPTFAFIDKSTTVYIYGNNFINRYF